MIGECAATCDFINKYMGLMSDFPHILFELTLWVVQDVLAVLGWRKFVKPRWNARLEKRIQVEHAILDKEHGVTHVDV